MTEITAKERERRSKISAKLKGRQFSAETRSRMVASQLRRFRAGLPREHRDAISRGSRGKKHPPDCGHCEAIRGANNVRWKDGASRREIKRRLLPGATFDPTVTRDAVLARAGWICAICTELIPDIEWISDVFQPEYGTVDHIIELSLGGSHSWDNVQAAHFSCNAERWYQLTREGAAR